MNKKTAFSKRCEKVKNVGKALLPLLLCFCLLCACEDEPVPVAEQTPQPTTAAPTATAGLPTPTTGSVVTDEPTNAPEATPAAETAVPTAEAENTPKITATPKATPKTTPKATAKPTLQPTEKPTAAPHVHTPVVDSAVKATCVIPGHTEGQHCSACGEVLVPPQTIPAPGHKIVTDSPVKATCQRTGLTEGQHCSVCGEVLMVQSVIPKIGHDYAPATYTAPATCRVCGATTGSKLTPEPMTITRTGYLPMLQPGGIRVNSATYRSQYNGDGTYKVTVTMSITNTTSSRRISGAVCYLSGMEAPDGTAIELSAGGSGTTYCYFYDLPGGTYELSF